MYRMDTIILEKGKEEIEASHEKERKEEIEASRERRINEIMRQEHNAQDKKRSFLKDFIEQYSKEEYRYNMDVDLFNHLLQHIQSLITTYPSYRTLKDIEKYLEDIGSKVYLYKLDDIDLIYKYYTVQGIFAILNKIRNLNKLRMGYPKDFPTDLSNLTEDNIDTIIDIESLIMKQRYEEYPEIKILHQKVGNMVAYLNSKMRENAGIKEAGIEDGKKAGIEDGIEDGKKETDVVPYINPWATKQGIQSRNTNNLIKDNLFSTIELSHSSNTPPSRLLSPSSKRNTQVLSPIPRKGGKKTKRHQKTKRNQKTKRRYNKNQNKKSNKKHR